MSSVVLGTWLKILKVRVKTRRGTEKAHELTCYGLDELAKVHRVVKAEQLQKKISLTLIWKIFRDLDILSFLSYTVKEDLLHKKKR